MKKFKIKKIKNLEYPYLILSTSYLNPLDELITIQNVLKNTFRGKVLFDLLLTNGLSSNRYIEAIFDGEKFDFTSFKPLNNVSEDIKKESVNFYTENYQLLRNSVLSKFQQFLIRNGEYL